MAKVEVLFLERFETGNQGTFGRLMKWYSIELPWRDNRSSVSSIPEGIYRAYWTYSPRFKRLMYILADTDPRVGIRVHPANLAGDKSLGYLSQLNGCIALGEKLGWIERQKAVLVSAPAVRAFEAMMGRKNFILEVRDA